MKEVMMDPRVAGIEGDLGVHKPNLQVVNCKTVKLHHVLTIAMVKCQCMRCKVYDA